MGKAYLAPMDHYERTRYVSVHAIERLRERIGDKHTLSFRGDADLGNAIDDAVKNGLASPNDFAEQTRAGRLEKIVDVSTYFGFPLRAIIAKNDRTDSKLEEAIVTIMDGPLMRPDAQPGGRPEAKGLGAIGDLIPREAYARLRAGAGAAAAEATREAEGPKPSSTPAPAPASSAAASSSFTTWQPQPTRRIIILTHPNAKDELFEAVDGEAVVSKLLELRAVGVDPSRITVWRPTRVSLDVKVSEES